MDYLTLKTKILTCKDCELRFGFMPIPIVYGNQNSRIFQISQAPSKNVHITNKPFNDNTGKKLKYIWYMLSDDVFYNPDNFYISAFSHCYPGKNKNGTDVVPTKYCADKWLKLEMSVVNNKIYVIIGKKAANYFFPDKKYDDLIFNDQMINGKETFILPHPSPLNVSWFKRNPNFEVTRMKYIRGKIWEAIYQK